MNAIEQFINFVSTLYTPRRACATVFMVSGSILSLYKFLPYLREWLEPALQPLANNYKLYIVAIAFLLGVSLSIVVFNILEMVCNLIIESYRQRKESKNEEKKKEELALVKNQKIKQDFQTAYEHLSPGKINILRDLFTNLTISYAIDNDDVIFLENSGWIEPLAYSSRDEKVYRIFPDIEEFIENKWIEEVNYNFLEFHKFDMATSSSITDFMSNLKTKAAIHIFDFGLYKNEIGNCFFLEKITSTIYTFKFKPRYRDKFQQVYQKDFREERMVTIIDNEEDP